MPAPPNVLTENKNVAIVARWLESSGWSIESTATGHEEEYAAALAATQGRQREAGSHVGQAV